MTLVKDGKTDIIQGGLLQWVFFNRGERLGSTLNTTRTGRHLQPGGRQGGRGCQWMEIDY